MKQVFGFGSLMSLKSLQVSAPSVEKVTPVYINWYRRDFSIWDPLGFTKTFPEICWTWFCALDVQVSNDQETQVNGVMFHVSNEEFEEIKIREQEYNIIEAECFGFFTYESLWNCYFFSANKNNWVYNHGCKAQEKYLQVCLEWAKNYGDMFYTQFLETTYIWNKDLTHYV